MKRWCAFQRLVDVVQEVHVFRIVQVIHLQELFDFCHALFRQVRALGLLVYLEIRLLLQLIDELVDLVVFVRRLFGRTGYDEGCPRLVDEDAVDFVHDRIVEVPLDKLVDGVLHVISQIIEAEFVVRAVGHVTAVLLFTLRVIDTVNDDTHRDAEESVNGPHPLRIPLCEIVVYRDHVDPRSTQRIEIDREGRHQGLALAGRHLGNLPLMEYYPSYELGIEMAHVYGSSRSFSYGGKSFGQDRIEFLALLKPLLELGRHPLQLFIRKRAYLLLVAVNFLDERPDPLQLPFVLRTDYFFE